MYIIKLIINLILLMLLMHHIVNLRIDCSLSDHVLICHDYSSQKNSRINRRINRTIRRTLEITLHIAYLLITIL